MSLNKSAIRPFAEGDRPTCDAYMLNGEGIPMNSPRSNTDEATPTIWQSVRVR